MKVFHFDTCGCVIVFLDPKDPNFDTGAYQETEKDKPIVLAETKGVKDRYTEFCKFHPESEADYTNLVSKKENKLKNDCVNQVALDNNIVPDIDPDSKQDRNAILWKYDTNRKLTIDNSKLTDTQITSSVSKIAIDPVLATKGVVVEPGKVSLTDDPKGIQGAAASASIDDSVDPVKP